MLRFLAFVLLLVLALLCAGAGFLVAMLMPSRELGFPAFLLGMVLCVVIAREAERVW